MFNKFLKFILNLLFVYRYNAWVIITCFPIGVAAYQSLWILLLLIPVIVVNVIGTRYMERMNGSV